MENNNIIDKRPIRLEDIMKEGYIPFLGGRPERENIISEDDIINLRINLNITSSVEEFLKIL